MDRELYGTVDHLDAIKTPAPTIKGFHHIAYRCRDAEETKKFYVDILGLKPAAALSFDKDPSGADRPFMHLFFEMADGNFIAFFDAPGNASNDLFHIKDGIDDYHFAFEVATMDEQRKFMDRLAEAKVPCFGPVDHNFCHSIYFFDPSGLACEITVRDENHDAILADEAGRMEHQIREWEAKTRTVRHARLALFGAD